MTRRYGHERTDLNTKALFWLASAAVPGAACLLALVWMFFFSGHPAVAIHHERPPAPRLQENPRADLADFLKKENELLSTPGWVDRRAGTVRIPIERAMKLLENHPTGRAPSSVSGVQSVAWEPHPGSRLPLDASFIDEGGRAISLHEAVGGLPALLVFSYLRCPNLCGLVTQGLIDSLVALPGVPGRDYRVISISIDPKESPRLALMKQRTLLARLSNAHPVDGAWRMLTGNERSIAAAASAAGFHFSRDPVSGEFAHPSGIIVVTPSGVLSRYFFGIRYPPEAVASALVEAGHGRFEGAEAPRSSPSLAEGFLLYCFHYDPESGARGSIILAVVRFFGAASALALLAFLIRLGAAR